jgi:hypothetical protein
VNRDADAVVAQANRYNDPPKDRYVMITYAATYRGSERSADPSWDLAWSVATENARIYEQDIDEVLPADDQEWRLEAPPGGTVKHQVVFDMPAALVNGATLTVEAWRSIDEEFDDFLL